MITSVQHPTAGIVPQLGVPVKLSETPGSVRRPPPRLGEHTDTVLQADLGLDADEIVRLRDAGTI